MCHNDVPQWDKLWGNQVAAFNDDTATSWRDLSGQLCAWQRIQLEDHEQIGDPPHVLLEDARAFAAGNR
jgi:hypothetical protein